MNGELESGSQPPPPTGYRIGGIIIVVLLVLLGVILISVGQLVFATANWDKSDEIKAAYKNNLILTGVGAMLSSIGLIGGALTMENVDKFVRLGMVIAAALIIGRFMTSGIYPYGYI